MEIREIMIREMFVAFIFMKITKKIKQTKEYIVG